MRLYQEGKLSGKAAHRVERYLLENDFAQEAMEGFDGFDQSDIDEDIEILNRRVSNNRRQFNWYYVAASVGLMLMAFAGVWIYVNQIEESGELSYQEESPTSEQPLSSDKQKPVNTSDHKENKEDLQVDPDVTENAKSREKPATILPKKSEIKNDPMVIEESQVAGKVEDSKPIVQAPLLAEAREEEVDIETLDEELEGISLSQIQLEEGFSDAINLEEIEMDTAYLNSKLSGRVAGVMISEESRSASESRTQSTLNVQNRKKVVIRGQASIQNHDLTYVTGQVTDEDGNPLPGVTVTVKGSNVGTISDIEGNYKVPRVKGTFLSFAYIGMESVDLRVGDQDTLNVTMETDVQALSEVVVIGYGTSDQVEEGYKSARPAVGMSDYKEYLETNLQYPELAREQKIEGKVILKVTVNSSGAITDVEVKRNLGFGCDEEAIRLVKEGPKWTPAERDGESVSSEVRVKVKFELED